MFATSYGPHSNHPLFWDSIIDCYIFSAFDLVKAHHQIPVAREDIPKVEICAPFEFLEFTRMALGISVTKPSLLFRIFGWCSGPILFWDWAFGAPSGDYPWPHPIEPSVSVSCFKLPKSVKDLRRLLRILNFYRRFLQNADHHQSIPKAYLSGSKTKNSR